MAVIERLGGKGIGFYCWKLFLITRFKGYEVCIHFWSLIESNIKILFIDIKRYSDTIHEISHYYMSNNKSII